MNVLLDHTIIPSKDKKRSADFYTRMFNFKDEGEEQGSGLHGIRIDDSLILFFEDSKDGSPWAQSIHHLAFGMNAKDFEQVFEKIKSWGISYGDHYSDPTNMKQPRVAPGARGQGKSIYFRDPSGNLLQIISYQG
jgi:catechol 2,3-dioxygenase-like lactoylglutathione lyase family enzyme